MAKDFGGYFFKTNSSQKFIADSEKSRTFAFHKNMI